MSRYIRMAIGLSIFLAAGAAAWLYEPLPDNPSAEILAQEAANYDVEILRDSWGVPHIYGQRDADVAFGVAYAHAEDDFETIQETVAATRGHLARYRGAAAAPTDYIVAMLDVWGTVEAHYDTDIPADVKAIAEAYAAGLNLYAAEHPNATWRGLAPFTGEDVVAGFIFKTPFFYGLDETLLALFGDERVAQIALDPNAERDAWIVGPKSATERGSNALAVSPVRSGDGSTHLLINSHQPMAGPVAWWEAHLVSEEGLDITGGLFPGTPIILHGFNQHLGWANTVNNPDLADVYQLTVDVERPGQYFLDGAWQPFSEETVEIGVKLWGPFVFKARRSLLQSAHGPVVEAPHGTYAIRYAGRGEFRQLEQYYRLNHATDLDSFLAAMALQALPSINYIYADKDGRIAFIYNGQYPDRVAGWDWSQDLPGDRSDLIWDAYLPFEAVPTLIDPESGFVFNANNQPFSATDGTDNLEPGDFPETMGLQTNETNRALRLIALGPRYETLDQTAIEAIKFDAFYAQGSEADAVIQAVLNHDWSDEPELADALAHLASWDMNMAADSPSAALGGLTVMREITARFTGEPAPEPADAFREAVAYLERHYGRIDPPWGDVNRLVRGDGSWPVSGGPDTLRAIYPAEIRDDGELHAAAGDTWIALVTWPQDGPVEAKLIHQFGSATLDRTSPHFGDQAPLFAEETWRKARLTREEIAADATRIYNPGQVQP